MTTRRWTAAALALALVALTVFSPSASAEEEKTAAEAKERFKSGVALFEKGNYAEAMEEFQRSFFLRPLWMLRYNIGLCYLKLGYKAEGATELELYLEKGGSEIKEAKVKEVKKILGELVPGLGVLQLKGDLAGVTVEVDGVVKPGPTQGGKVYVRPGTHGVTILRDGTPGAPKEIAVDKAQSVELGASPLLDDVPPPKPAEKPPEPAPPAPQASCDEVCKEREAAAYEEFQETSARKKKVRLALWGALGLTAASLAAGTTLGLLAVKERDAMRDDEALAAGGDAAALSARDGHYGTGTLYADAATGLLAAGAAAALASVILGTWPWGKESGKKGGGGKPGAQGKKAASTALLPAPGGAGLVVTW